MKVYVGYDPREAAAYDVAEGTLWDTSRIRAEPLDVERLQRVGLYTRVTDYRGGQDYDFASNAPASTRFALTRFLVPLLCQKGYALFTDCDMLFHANVEQMFDEVATQPRRAVYVVKHSHPGMEKTKMKGQAQTSYPRKNWSSVMLFDCDHPSNQRLSVDYINRIPGRELHAFSWLHNDEIGTLQPRWNWLVGVTPRPLNVAISHYTLGGPWFPEWTRSRVDPEWEEADAAWVEYARRG